MSAQRAIIHEALVPVGDAWFDETARAVRIDVSVLPFGFIRLQARVAERVMQRRDGR
jgi:hypothetical protein